MSAQGFPEVPDLADTFLLLSERYGFRVDGRLPVGFRWVVRRRELLLPTRGGERYVVEAHYVFPSINLHLVHVRSRWCVDGRCEDVVHERVEFMPWAPSHVPVKDVMMGREVAERGN